ncbi:hypothetical protein EDF68_1011010 [Ochrobactrum sp. BH3]|nr:hypothetical protein EDF68_1011010 [Ochrobactrum sp. BH3]
MATQVQIRRSDETDNETFVGARSEVTHDMVLKALRVHDGATPGGNRTLMESELGVPGGVAELDELGQIPQEQLGNLPTVSSFASRNVVLTSQISAEHTYISTAGNLAPGDRGEALYRRVSAEPSHPGKVQSADGAWWEQVANFISVKQFNGTDSGLFWLASQFAQGKEILVPAGQYVLSGDINFPAETNLHFEYGVTVTGGKLINANIRYDRQSVGASATQIRLGHMLTRAPNHRLEDFQKQWSVGSPYVQMSELFTGAHVEFEQNSTASPNGWPQAALVGSAVSANGNKDFPAGIHAYGWCLTNGGSVWGQNIVVGNGKDVSTPMSTPRFLCGLEIDMQPSQGSTVQDGAGLLVNSFWCPVNYAAVAIVADAGGSWGDGVYIQGAKAAGINYANGATMVTGIDLSKATFSSGNAIALKPSQRVLFKDTDGTGGGALYSTGDGTFYARVSKQLNVLAGSTGENTTVFDCLNDGTFHEFFKVSVGLTGGANSAQTVVSIAKNSGTNRSLNAAGTINASGADYAEYEEKSDTSVVFEKADIVGFNGDGKLTNIFSEATSFAVKSTNPNLVGGDDWHLAIGDAPVEPRYTGFPEEWDGGPEPAFNKMISIEKNDEVLRLWTEKRASFDALAQQHYQDWNESSYADYLVLKAAYAEKLEAERVKYDRIAYCGKVPVNIHGGSVGDYLLPCPSDEGKVTGVFIAETDLSFEQYKISIGRVRRILPDGRAEIVVKPI